MSSLENTRPKSRRRRAASTTIVLLLAVTVSGAAGWALKEVITPPPNVLQAASFTTAEAVEGKVGQSLNLNAVASWKTSRSLANQAEGMVTSVDAAAGSRVSVGDVLYRVALRPVVAAKGDVPAFRDIGAGVRGDDVRQLQESLAQLGFDGGEVDGRADWRTVQAIKAWQRSLGVEPDGVVRTGDVVFLPTMPAIISYSDISVGRPLSPGAGTVNVLGEAPEFTISLSDTQARVVKAGTPVTLTHRESQWQAQVEQVTPASGDAPAKARLASAGDGVICGESCTDLAVSQETALPATIVVVPEQVGIVVPAAALVSDVEGKTVVVLSDGTVVPVTVVASARGSAVVEGLKAGKQVRVPGVLPTPDSEDDK